MAMTRVSYWNPFMRQWLSSDKWAGVLWREGDPSFTYLEVWTHRFAPESRYDGMLGFVRLLSDYGYPELRRRWLHDFSFSKNDFPVYFLLMKRNGERTARQDDGKLEVEVPWARLPEPLRGREFVPLRNPTIDPFTGEVVETADAGSGFLPWRGP